jgi:iron complex transport system ATP-binding protein
MMQQPIAVARGGNSGADGPEIEEGMAMNDGAILLRAENLACGYERRPLIGNLSFTVAAGDFLCLLGPNGVGKTTLFKTLLRLLPVRSGRVLLLGRNLLSWPRRQFAALVGYLPQGQMPAFPFRAIDLVATGRIAHLGPLGAPSRQDMELAEEALEALSVAHLRLRPCAELSGGERQLVLLARALIQQPTVLMLDEPTFNLDFDNQVRVLNQVARLADGRRLGVVMTSHDPNHALRHASKVATLGRDGGFAVGPPAVIVTEAYLRQTYGAAAAGAAANRA